MDSHVTDVIGKALLEFDDDFPSHYAFTIGLVPTCLWIRARPKAYCKTQCDLHTYCYQQTRS